MRGAIFLLVINFAIGLSFAIAFLGLSWRSRIGLGFWCAAGFVSASATAAVEALAPLIASPRLISALSFTFLMLALTLIVTGIARHYRPRMPVGPIWLLFAVMVAFDLGVTYDLRRDTLGHGIAYQAPYAIITALGAGLILGARGRHPADLALAGVLALSSLQFVLKAAAPLFADGTAPDVRGYIYSLYAFYSQTLGAVFSVLLGLSLLGVIIVEVVAKTMGRLQRDSLSGLLNRAAFLDRAVAVAGSLGPGRQVWLVMIDLDHFKSINDRFGHAAGDEVIRAFGEVLNDLAPSGHVAGRLGGEEFCLLLPDMGEVVLAGCLDAIRMALRGASYALVSEEVRVTASFGVALLNAGMRVDQAMRRADLALYQAKAAGRDRVVLADPLSAEDRLPVERRKAPFAGG
jgi:diguanylate cyclase (GGDEF)-like protein